MAETPAPAPTGIAFSDFQKELAGTIQQFYSTYQKGMSNEPENWPTTQPTMADWWDQFNAHISEK